MQFTFPKQQRFCQLHGLLLVQGRFLTPPPHCRLLQDLLIRYISLNPYLWPEQFKCQLPDQRNPLSTPSASWHRIGDDRNICTHAMSSTRVGPSNHPVESSWGTLRSWRLRLRTPRPPLAPGSHRRKPPPSPCPWPAFCSHYSSRCWNSPVAIPDICHERRERRACKFFG